jgi:hypothetical protein
LNRDLIELLAAFNAQSVDYLVVGAHALAAHGHVRATKDLDVWVRPSSDNALRVMRALVVFGAPLQDLTAEDLAVPGISRIWPTWSASKRSKARVRLCRGNCARLMAGRTHRTRVIVAVSTLHSVDRRQK